MRIFGATHLQEARAHSVARTEATGRICGVSAALVGVAACATALVPPPWEAQARTASQQIRIGARVKPFCRMGHAHHYGLHLYGRTLGGHRIDRRYGGKRYNVICNTPYALHLQRWQVAPYDWQHEHRPGYLRVENTRDLDVRLQFAGRVAAVERRCVLAALNPGPGICPALGESEAEEATFPPSRTVAWLKVEPRPAHIPRPLPQQPVAEAIYYEEPGEVRLARGTEWAEDVWENAGEYVSLSVTARY
jgi:hypothetical protein